MTIPPEALTIIKRWEGYHKRLSDGRAAPYLCPAKVATCGWGTTVWPGGRKVSMQDEPITAEYADQCLLSDIERKYGPPVRRAIKVEMHPLMWAACYSLAYNIGTGAFAKSTLVRRINAREWASCPAAFKMYRIGGGRVLTGLVKRRADEAALFMQGVAKLSNTPINPPPAATLTADSAAEGFWAKVIRGILSGLGRSPVA